MNLSTTMLNKDNFPISHRPFHMNSLYLTARPKPTVRKSIINQSLICVTTKRE